MGRLRLIINNVDVSSIGAHLEDGALNALMAFTPMKQPVTNTNVTDHGSHIVCGTGLREEYTLSLPIVITAANSEEFTRRHASFAALLSSGVLAVTVYDLYANSETPIYSNSLHYRSCSQYIQNINGIAKFTLTLYHPNN